MTSATTSAAPPRPAVRNAPARRTAPLVVLLATLLALAGTTAVGPGAAAAERSQDDIWVNVDGVAFQRGSESDEVAYVVRPVGARRGAQAYARSLTRDEQNHGWTTFWEARRAFPDGYCVVWVEVEDASNWHESEGSTVCTASQPAETSTPTPTPTATKTDRPAPEPVAPAEQNQEQERTQQPERARPQATPAAPPPSAAPTPDPTPEPTPTPTPTPSASPSPSASGTPSPSASPTSPDVALMQGMIDQQGAEPRVAPAGADEVITPLGWVAVLGSGALLTTGGLLLLWRRLT